MSRLLEKGRLRVQQEEIVNDFISKGFLRSPEIFSTDCPEYEAFTSMINTDINTSLGIHTVGIDVDSIKTEFNPERGRVWYTLYLGPEWR